MDLFAYGSLMYPDVLIALLDRVPERVDATVPGWRAAALPDRVYPGLVSAPAAVTAGQVVRGLTAAEVRLLDAYESADYRRGAVTLDDGRPCAAYLWHGPVLAHDWDRRHFATVLLPAYAAHCARWRATHAPPPPPAP